MKSEGAGSVAIILDSSGSCVPDWPQFLSEIQAVHGDVSPENLILLQCDTKVTYDEVFEEYDVFPDAKDIPVKGYGGTRFSPAFKYLNEKYPDIEAAVYLTDCYSDDFGEEPHYPVLWVSTTNDWKPPWGQYVVMTPEARD
jgi:predicted metal-dependent peptidase